jgi:hypothetical protein
VTVLQISTLGLAVLTNTLFYLYSFRLTSLPIACAGYGIYCHLWTGAILCGFAPRDLQVRWIAVQGAVSSFDRVWRGNQLFDIFVSSAPASVAFGGPRVFVCGSAELDAISAFPDCDVRHFQLVLPLYRDTGEENELPLLETGPIRIARYCKSLLSEAGPSGR